MKDKHKSEIALIVKNIFSGLFPVITVLAYQNSLSPLYTLAISSLIASIFFAILLTIRGEWKKSFSNKKAIKDIVLAVIIIAIGYHSLYFIALNYTSATNVSILSLMEIVFSFFIIGFLFKKEPISLKHFLGAMLMMIGAILILFRNKTDFNIGDIFMLIATCIAPIGNIFAKRALHQVSLSYLMFCRSLLGGIVFYIAALTFEPTIDIDTIMKSIPYLLFSGLIFLGALKIVTMFSFKKTSVTHTLSFQALKPLFTVIFAWLILSEIPTSNQLVAIIPILLGLFIITSTNLKPTQYKV